MEQKKLRFDASISWGDLITGVTLLVTGLFAFSTLQTRVSLNEERISVAGQRINVAHNELVSHITDEQERRDQMRIEIKEDLKTINEKLDALIVRSHE